MITINTFVIFLFVLRATSLERNTTTLFRTLYYSEEGEWEIATTSREVNSRLGEGYHTQGKYQ